MVFNPTGEYRVFGSIVVSDYMAMVIIVACGTLAEFIHRLCTCLTVVLMAIHTVVNTVLR